jgi:hypothetical protein
MSNPRGYTIARDRDGAALRVEPFEGAYYLEGTAPFSVKLTVATARRLIAELMPYTEWLPPGPKRERPRR